LNVCDSLETGIDTLILSYDNTVICDSLITITQRILAPSWYIDTTLYICEGDSIEIGGEWYTATDEVESTLLSSLGCDSILYIDLQVISPPQFVSYIDTLVAAGSNLTLQAPFLTGYNYLWEPPDGLSCNTCPDPKILAEEDKSITLYFSDSQGCFSHIVNYDIKVYAEEIAIPNVFTPNGDGVNDRFGIVIVKGPTSSVTIHHFSVFNRWGNEVFSSRDVDNTWDGLINGEPCPMDNYAWILDVEYGNGKREVLRGHVTLVR